MKCSCGQVSQKAHCGAFSSAVFDDLGGVRNKQLGASSTSLPYSRFPREITRLSVQWSQKNHEFVNITHTQTQYSLLIPILSHRTPRPNELFLETHLLSIIYLNKKWETRVQNLFFCSNFCDLENTLCHVGKSGRNYGRECIIPACANDH